MPARNLILHNFWWKLLSLLLAALTWLTIDTAFQKNERLAEASREMVTESRRPFDIVPITLMASPSNTNRYTVNPEEVSVIVGGGKDLDGLQSHRVEAFVDVTDAEDEKQFRRPVQVHVPPGFAVLSVNPSNAIIERITSAK